MKKGYSLIELIVVFSIIALVLPAIFAIFFTVIRLQLELTGFTYIRKEGDRIQQDVTRTIRNGGSAVLESCDITDYNSSACVVSDTDKTGFDIDAGVMRKFIAGSSSPVVSSSSNSAFDIVFVDGDVMEGMSPKSVYVQYTIQAVPKTSFLRTQELTYRFLVTLRK